VSVKPLPLINTGNDRSICIGDSVTLTATTNGTSLLWNTGLSSNSIIVKPITTTNYSATATLNSCTNFDGISVAVKPLPNINFTKLLNGSEVQLIAPNGNTTYNWNFGDGSSTSTTQNPTHTYATNGKKYITLVSTLNGCTAQKTDSVTIAITAIKNNISFVDKIEVFPNPTDDFVTVQLKSKKAADFRALLITIDGKIIVSREYVNTTIINDEISLKNYSSGVYFLQIESENEQATYQLIKN
jgi:PKD repeat protein